MSDRPLARPTPGDFNGVRDMIVELFCQGRSPSFIATAVGLKKKTVDQLIKSEFQTRLGSRQELIMQTGMELKNLKDTLARKYYEDGDRRDAELALKYQDRLCKLFGLDEPVKHEVRVEDWTEEQIVEQLKINNIETSLTKTLPEPVEDAIVEEKANGAEDPGSIEGDEPTEGRGIV